MGPAWPKRLCGERGCKLNFRTSSVFFLFPSGLRALTFPWQEERGTESYTRGTSSIHHPQGLQEILAEKLEETCDSQASMPALFQSQQPREESLPCSEWLPAQCVAQPSRRILAALVEMREMKNSNSFSQQEYHF